MKKALILGTLSPQADAVRYLKGAGWWVIGCGHRRTGKALEIIDQFELVDITDYSALEAMARREKVDLIYSVGSEIAMPAIAYVAPRLGLPSFISYEMAQMMHNKIALRTFLAKHNISPVKFRRVNQLEDVQGWDIFPAMVKPTDCQGQRGVFRADSMPEVLAGLERSLNFSASHTIILEEFLDGPEVSSNAFVIDSRVVFNKVSDRLVVEGYPGGIPRGHVLPSQNCRGDLLRQTKLLVEQCIHALKIENGPVYFQMKLTACGPRIVEIMPRLDGCHIWRLIKTVWGVDLLAACFRLLDGDRSMEFIVHPSPDVHCLMFWLNPEGTFDENDHPAPPDVLYSEYRYKNGETIRPMNGFLDVVGYYIRRRV